MANKQARAVSRRGSGVSLGTGSSSENARVDAWSLLLANIAGLTGMLASVEPGLTRLGLDHKTLFLLSLLGTHDQPSALARALAVPRPTITALVKRAEERELLRRDAVRGDLRRFRLTITPKGREVLGAGRGLIERAMGARIEGVSKSDLEAFARVVEAIGRAH